MIHADDHFPDNYQGLEGERCRMFGCSIFSETVLDVIFCQFVTEVVVSAVHMAIWITSFANDDPHCSF